MRDRSAAPRFLKVRNRKERPGRASQPLNSIRRRFQMWDAATWKTGRASDAQITGRMVVQMMAVSLPKLKALYACALILTLSLTLIENANGAPKSKRGAARSSKVSKSKSKSARASSRGSRASTRVKGRGSKRDRQLAARG